MPHHESMDHDEELTALCAQIAARLPEHALAHVYGHRIYINHEGQWHIRIALLQKEPRRMTHADVLAEYAHVKTGTRVRGETLMAEEETLKQLSKEFVPHVRHAHQKISAKVVL